MAPIPEFHPTLIAIEGIDLQDIPVFLLDRYAPRKAQAVAARTLFKKLGLKGISVTVPVYSMASTVHIRMPKAPWSDELQDEWDQAFHHSVCGDAINETALGKIRARNHAIHQRLEGILAVAFPNHTDKSDPQSDHFDSRWSID